MSDSSFKTHGITRPWVPWLLKKSISQYLTSLMQQASNSSWAKPCLLEGLWRAFSWGQDEKAAGNREMSRWPQPALGNLCCCSNINSYTPRHVSLKLSNGWIQVSFKKPFPPATFVWVFPLYTQGLTIRLSSREEVSKMQSDTCSQCSE